MSLDRGIIDQQLQALGEGPHWWEVREFRDLPAVLEADERILAIARGKVGRLRWMRRSWLIVVTDRRLVCLRSAGQSWRQFDVSAGLIQRVVLRVAPFHGRVLVFAGGQTYRLRVPRLDAYRLHDALSRLGGGARDVYTGFEPVRMVRRVIDHVLSLPAVAVQPHSPKELAPPAIAMTLYDQRVQTLEDEVQELRQQVRFLEQLLHERHAAETEPFGNR
jgi:hypothetical protein